MIKNLLIFAILACAGALSAQTYTFECVVNGRLSGDSCDVCPNTIIESRSFNGLVIFRDSAFYKWIDQPYSVRVKPGGIVEYWEHAVNPFSERVTIPFSETGFFSIQGMADSTWCNSVAPHRYQELSLDSLSTTLAKAKLQAGNTGFGLRAGTSVTFDWQNDTLQINVDTTGLGGGGGGSGTVTSVAATAPAAGFSISGSPITTAGTFVFTLANDLAALEGLGSTGIPARTGTDTWSLRSIAGGTGISVSNGDGVSGNPTVTNTAPDQTVVLTAGAGISTSGTYPNFTIASTITQGYNKIRNNAGTLMTLREAMQFLNSTRIAITLADDAVNAETDITADLVIASVADAYLQNRGSLTVMGRASNTGGVVADIVSTADGQVLRRNGTTLDWGTVVTNGITNQAVTYVKIQNAAANNVLLGNNNGAGTSYEEINAAAAQTMLGYIDGNLVAGGRVAYSSDANTLTTEAAFLYSAANDRMTIVSTTPALGAGAAILNLQNAGNDPSGEFLRMDGNITGNLLAGMSNSSTAAATDNTLFYISQAGNSAGDPILQFNVTGAGGTSAAIGIDNSDANKLKFTPNATTPGANANASFVGTNDAAPLWGINNDAPGRTLDVGGGARAVNLLNTSAPPTASNLGSGLGTGGSVDVITGGNNGFTVTFTVGTAPVADGPLFRLTFANAFTTTSHVTMNFNRDPDTIIDRDKIMINGTSPGFIDLKANGTMTASKGHILVFNVIGQ